MSLVNSWKSWRSAMRERSGLFISPKNPVLSLAVQAEEFTIGREQSQFEILVRHIFYRFLHNELLTSDDDETKRVMQISCAVAVPGLLVALFLFPAYHAFPPYPPHRLFWAQAADHYFYVMYSFVIMGAATVFEWDLLFPDLVDVFVLSIQPIPSRDLFFARVLALAVFLGLVLLGTSILGIIFLPLVAELPSFLRHLLAHSTAVLASGTFAAATFLALQGILLNIVGENIFRRITPLLQGASVMLLLTILLLHPTLSMSLKPLLASNAQAIRLFPPFWFLGMYERILMGPSAPLIFHELARIGCYALLLMLACTVFTYPLAYRRRVRQLIEGGRAIKRRNRTTAPFQRILQATIVRLPAQRAIFHFISQTILRAQRQRVMLAMYGGLGIALALSDLLVFRVGAGHVQPVLLPSGIRSAVPVMVFWTVAGLRSVLTNSIDRRGAWLFRVIIGRAGADHLVGTRVWVTLWATIVGLTTAIVLYALSPATLQSHLTTLDQLLIAIAVSFLLIDIFLFSVRNVPFTTQFRKSSITDLPLVIVRYVVLFPLLVIIIVQSEDWIEASSLHLLKALLFLVAAHLLFLKAHARSLGQSTLDTPPDETDEFPQRLGLQDS